MWNIVPPGLDGQDDPFWQDSVCLNFYLFWKKNKGMCTFWHHFQLPSHIFKAMDDGSGWVRDVTNGNFEVLSWHAQLVSFTFIRITHYLFLVSHNQTVSTSL